MLDRSAVGQLSLLSSRTKWQRLPADDTLRIWQQIPYYQCYLIYYWPTKIYLYRSEPSTTHYKIPFSSQIALIQPNNIIVNTTSRDLQLLWIDTKIWSIRNGPGRIYTQEAQLSLTNRAVLVCKVVEVGMQDFLSEYVDKKFTYICYRRLIRHEWIYNGSKNV